MKHKFSILLSALVLVLLLTTSCTTNIDPQGILKTNAQVQSFLESYPNSDVQIVAVSATNVPSITEDYVRECGVAPESMDYYRATLTNSDVVLHAWINKNTQEFVCIYREQKNKPAEPVQQATVATVSANATAQPPSLPSNAIVAQTTASTCSPESGEIYVSNNEAKTICVNGVSHKIEIAPSTSTKFGLIKIDNSSARVSEDSVFSVAGIKFFVKDLFSTSIPTPSIGATIIFGSNLDSLCSDDTEHVTLSFTETKTICFDGMKRKLNIRSLDSNSVVSVGINGQYVNAAELASTTVNGVQLIVSEVFSTNIPTPSTSATIYFGTNPQIPTEPPTTVVTPTPINQTACSTETVSKYITSNNFELVCVNGYNHIIEVKSASGTSAIISIDGVEGTVQKEASTRINGVRIYASDVFATTIPAPSAAVTLYFGENPIIPTEPPTTVVNPIPINQTTCPQETGSLTISSDNSLIVCAQGFTHVLTVVPDSSNTFVKLEVDGVQASVSINTNTQINGVNLYVTDIFSTTIPTLSTAATVHLGVMP